MATAHQAKWLNLLKHFFIAFFIVLLVLGIIYQCIRNNIHAVIPNEVYRSAQLPKDQLDRFIKNHHIQSVINLRGKNVGMLAYQNEISVSRENHIQHYDIRLDSYVLPNIQQLRQLTFLLQTAKRPFLIHCESGADRSGLASAIVLTLYSNDSLHTIKKEFSWRYFVTSPDSVGKQVYRLYEAWLLKTNRTSNKKNFLAWLNLSKPYAV